MYIKDSERTLTDSSVTKFGSTESDLDKKEIGTVRAIKRAFEEIKRIPALQESMVLYEVCDICEALDAMLHARINGNADTETSHTLLLVESTVKAFFTETSLKRAINQTLKNKTSFSDLRKLQDAVISLSCHQQLVCRN